MLVLVPHAPDMPLRRCSACRGSAVCRVSTHRSVNLLSTGTTYDYECTSCSATFRIESAYGTALSALGAPFFGALGALVLGARHLGAPAVGLGGLFVLVSMLALGRATWSIVARVRHPVVA